MCEKTAKTTRVCVLTPRHSDNMGWTSGLHLYWEHPGDEESPPSSSIRNQRPDTETTRENDTSTFSEVEVFLWVVSCCFTNSSQKSDLQPYGAPDGTAVFVLIVKLQMRNQQLEHSTGVTGGQTVQFTLEKRRDTITGAATENIRDYSDRTTRCCSTCSMSSRPSMAVRTSSMGDSTHSSRSPSIEHDNGRLATYRSTGSTNCCANSEMLHKIK